ncbi:MAG: DUF5916 domain-containing protein [Bacteroidota bacterium]
MRIHFLFCFLLFQSFFIYGQGDFSKKELSIKKVKQSIKLDGKLNEIDWLEADVAKGFFQQFPEDSVPSRQDSEARFTFDNDNLYVSYVCFSESGDYIIESLRRDFSFGRNDNMSLYFDSFGDKTNGFTFGITPAGIQREGLLTNGEDISTDWDNKWYSKVIVEGDRWVAELKIPFKSIRYNDNLLEWNIQLLRNNLLTNERTVWNLVPQGFGPSSMAFSGSLIWIDPPPKSQRNVSLIPYVSSRVDRDFENNESTDFDFEAGFDAKVAVSSSLNLDLTVNPDFSNVEVDQQVTNLTRFELFFPERRQFFLENSDLFARFGFPQSRAFFSRRIGLDVPIIAGARLSGKIGTDWRIGLLNVQTQDGIDADGRILPNRNYTIAAFQRQVFSRSNISGLFINKHAFDVSDDQFGEGIFGDSTRFNRVWGLEYNLLTPNDRWEGDFFFFQSYSPVRGNENFAQGGFLRYRTQTFEIGWSNEFIGEDYLSEVGFVQRPGTYRIRPFTGYTIYPESKSINSHTFDLNYEYITNSDIDRIEENYGASYSINFLNTSRLRFDWDRNFVVLQDDFNVSRVSDDDIPVLAAGTSYMWNSFSIDYNDDRRKTFAINASGSAGGFFNGNLYRGTLELLYRLQPFLNITALIDYNRVEVPSDFIDTDFFLIGPRVELTFSDQVFLTTFVQYNEQDDNLNINSRLQWRFKPVSDLFVVYSDNYFPDGLARRNRALVIKLSYWINV